MKARCIRALVLLTALACCASFFVPRALADQEIELDSVYARLRFPDPWLVLTPASLPVYAGILREAGLDPETFETRFAEDGVVAEGWSDAFDDSYRLLVYEDDRSQTLFDISRATSADRKAIAASFSSGQAVRTANLRYQETKWSKAGELGWMLFLRYNVMRDGGIAERGVQYFTIRNGQNYILDWRIGPRRITNRDLARFKEMLGRLTFPMGPDIPPLAARLEISGGFPAETGVGEVRLQGVTEPEAGLLLTRAADGGTETITVGSANRKGEFSLDFSLAEQGDYNLTLTASKDGYADTSVNGTVTYQPGWLAVNIDQQPGEVYDQPTYKLSGTAPAGTELQIVVTGRPAIHRKVGGDGRFGVEIDTALSGQYSIVLIAKLKGFTERRITIEFTRVASEEEERNALRAMVKRATYAQLIRDPDDYMGEVMTFTGDVLEISHGGEVWFIRLDVSRTRDALWPMVVVCDVDPELLPGARITFYARANAPYQEQDAGGSEISVPALSLLWIE